MVTLPFEYSNSSIVVLTNNEFFFEFAHLVLLTVLVVMLCHCATVRV